LVICNPIPQDEGNHVSDQLEIKKSIVRRFFAAIEANDADAFDDLVDEQYVDHLPGQAPGRENLKNYIAALHRGLSELTMPIVHMIAEGEMVAVLNKVVGIHGGNLLGYPASGNRVDVTNFQLYRLQDGRLAEHWEVADFATLTSQLAKPAGDMRIA
jgi:steroid delta-isomerase-like uncharacterized protein